VFTIMEKKVINETTKAILTSNTTAFMFSILKIRYFPSPSLLGYSVEN
jgi:hypothetical protein